MLKHVRRSMLTAILILLLTAGTRSQTHADYLKEIEYWHIGIINDLKAPDGYLNLVGLYWLEEGKNSFGSGPHNKIVFPPGTIPETAGYFERNGMCCLLK